jgi:23S rRNA (uracil1939-C5)-methyltransferase
MRRAQIKQKPEAIVEIKSLSHDGRGIAHINDKITFISGALPGETIRCQLTKRHSRYNEGITLDVITASKDRTTPGCQHFTVCGGCSLQHMDIAHQLQFKQNVFIEQLKHFGQVEPEILLPPLSGNPWNYRRKARLGVRFVKKKEKVLVGFREKFSNFLAELQECPVLHESVGTHLQDLSTLIMSLSQYEHIAQIEVAVSDNESALVFRNLAPLPSEDIEKLCDFGKQFNFHIYLQPGSPESTHKIWPENNNNKLTYQLSEYQLAMQFHPLDFTQINGELNPLMIQQALQLLAPQSEDNILDLFCGLGNFTLPMARYANHVTGIEGSTEMVLRARNNAEHNQITNTDFFAANLMQPAPQETWMQKKYHKILLDPPRSGAQEIIEFFPNFSASRVVYVSCNPATLARDAKELVHKQHYQLKSAGIINMFPHTSHIEAIALFEK